MEGIGVIFNKKVYDFINNLDCSQENRFMVKPGSLNIFNDNYRMMFICGFAGICVINNALLLKTVFPVLEVGIKNAAPEQALECNH